MRGRYRLSRRKQIIEEHFDCDPWDDKPLVATLALVCAVISSPI